MSRTAGRWTRFRFLEPPWVSAGFTRGPRCPRVAPSPSRRRRFETPSQVQKTKRAALKCHFSERLTSAQLTRGFKKRTRHLRRPSPSHLFFFFSRLSIEAAERANRSCRQQKHFLSPRSALRRKKKKKKEMTGGGQKMEVTREPWHRKGQTSEEIINST